jgi:hypothetical protein
MCGSLARSINRGQLGTATTEALGELVRRFRERLPGSVDDGSEKVLQK